MALLLSLVAGCNRSSGGDDGGLSVRDDTKGFGEEGEVPKLLSVHTDSDDISLP
jgi:hypothetical protein